LLAIGSLAAGRAGAGAEQWFPLRAGERWGYSLHADHTYAPSNAKIDRTFREGAAVFEVTSVGAGAQREVRETRSERQVGSPLPAPLQRVQHYEVGADLLLRGTSSVGKRDEVRYEPPLRVLPASPESSSPWRVGMIREDGTETEVTGEVLGREDVTEAGMRYEGCLKVRYAGPVRGTTPIYTGPVPIRSGRLERITWLAAGVGIVREVSTLDAEIELPDGVTARISQVLTLRLRDHRPGP
jgi:hypothetical protein